MDLMTWPSRRALRVRRRVRTAAAVLACAAAAIYTAIGTGHLVVLDGQNASTTLQQATFGLPAALLYLGLAVVALVADSRVVWLGAAAIQAVFLTMYADLAMVRSPAFEPVGITLSGLQVLLLVLFGWLALRRTQAAYKSRSPSNRLTGAGARRLLIAHDGNEQAARVADVLADHCAVAGITADSRDAADVHDATAYDGIAIIGRLRHGSWSWKLQRFHHLHYHALVARHVWLVTVVPDRADGPPVTVTPRTVRRIRKTLGVHSHTVVSGQDLQAQLRHLAAAVSRMLAGPLYRSAAAPTDPSRETSRVLQP